jgi:hypothetical protein
VNKMKQNYSVRFWVSMPAGTTVCAQMLVWHPAMCAWQWTATVMHANGCTLPNNFCWNWNLNIMSLHKFLIWKHLVSLVKYCSMVASLRAGPHSCYHIQLQDLGVLLQWSCTLQDYNVLAISHL